MGTLQRAAAPAIGLFAATLLLVGCGDGRDVRDPNTFYACQSNDDCVANYSCQCGWCQPIGGTPVACGDTSADAGPTDTGGTKDAGPKDAGPKDAGPKDTGPKDTGPQDTGPKDSGSTTGCNLLSWKPCPTGQGCFYDENVPESYCAAHGTKTFEQACNNSGKQPECALKGTVPMLCDVIDSKCYPVCDAKDAGKQGSCPSGYKCYSLQDTHKKALPDNVGICAPG